MWDINRKMLDFELLCCYSCPQLKYLFLSCNPTSVRYITLHYIFTCANFSKSDTTRLIVLYLVCSGKLGYSVSLGKTVMQKLISELLQMNEQKLISGSIEGWYLWRDAK